MVVGRRREEISVGSQPVLSEDRHAKVTVTVTTREIQNTNSKFTATACTHSPTHTPYKSITSTNTTILRRHSTRHPANRTVVLRRSRSRPSSLQTLQRYHSLGQLRERPRQASGPHRLTQAPCSYKPGMRSTWLKVWVGRLGRTSDPSEVSHRRSRNNRLTSARIGTRMEFRKM